VTKNKVIRPSNCVLFRNWKKDFIHKIDEKCEILKVIENTEKNTEQFEEPVFLFI